MVLQSIHRLSMSAMEPADRTKETDVMDRQELKNLASRVANAPSYEARIAELIRATPEATLNRFGLAHQMGWMGPFLALTGAFAIGAGIGAGTALLLAPSSGEELRGKLRQRAKRVGQGVKEVKGKAEERAVNARDRVFSSPQSKPGYSASGDSIDSPTRTAGF